GGDKTGMDDLLTALEESGKENNDSTRFSSSPYARYARFYEAWKDTLADPLLATVYHSMTNNFDDNGNAGLTLTPNPDGLYVVAQSKPCEYGEDYRLVYLIATRDIDPTERTIKVDLPLPAGERVKSVVLLSPNFVSERESKYGRAIPEQSEAGSGAVASYATEKNALSIVLGNFNNFSILLIHFEDMFSTRLSIESTYPLDGDLDVPCTDSVAVTFDKPIATSTVNEKSFRLSFDDRMVEGRYELSNEDRTVVLKPRKPLQENSMHSVTITTNIASTDEKTLTGDTSWSFLTAIKEPPRGKKAYDYGFYAAQAVMWSQVNHDKLQGFWSFGFALRDNRGLGWTWADMNPRSSEGSSFSFQNAFVMFRLAKDLYLPGGDYQSESNNDIYLLAGFQRMAISYHDHEEWRVSSQSPKIYRKNSVVMEEELYKPAFGFGWIMMELDRSTVSCSSLLFTPFENLNWGIQINSFAGFGIAPYADVIIALFFSDNPKFSNYGLGMGVQFGF
ncbi:MAG: Ig-like domain-containing protein, partial [Candidatus Krumholzibacteria bacterium]|nr:Ig-like domain-containing protein [Candidatus Krumholzibacteria bacterium]